METEEMEMEMEEMEMEMEIETEKEMEMETGKGRQCTNGSRHVAGKGRQRMRRRKCLVVTKATWR